MDWPLQCDNCGETYESENDSDIGTRKAQYKHGRVYKEYACLNCVEPDFFPDSKIMKKLHIARGKVKNTEDGLIAAIQVDKKWLD